MSSANSDPGATLPPVDEHLVTPGMGYELDDGRLVRVPPAKEPHAEWHQTAAALLGAHVVPEYKVVIDMLTRVGERTDIAPDLAVLARARDPVTGGRHVEELAFEIVSTGSLARAAVRAGQLAARGVRRVFAMDVERERMFELRFGTWEQLDRDAALEDPTLARPLPVAAFLGALAVDDQIAQALLTKRNPTLHAALEEQRVEGRTEGRMEGRGEALLHILQARGLAPTQDQYERISGERDPAVLARWLAGCVTCASVEELLERE